MAQITSPDRLSAAIAAALEVETRKVIDEEAEAAAGKVRERIHGLVGKISLSVLSSFDVERFGNDLRIIVRNGAKDGA